MEDVRNQLYSFIEKYGTLDPRTLDKSRELDSLIVKEMKKFKPISMLEAIKEIEKLKSLTKSLTRELSEKTVLNMELESQLKDANEEIKKLKDSASLWADEVAKNYHEVGDLEKAQRMTGIEIMAYELSKGKENNSVKNMQF
ncbi:aspartyl-phosphate phosphatase Spo0E family protein [Clostridium sporogenes]|uniref:aspartyl-phosphate phosphatase Spo0E family protein n=1 Tax=Clostridium sporogenes TaxID=1509 RepID=UPI0015EE80B9|nr:aspartyl-phosphate phosphatase Spo0E family protein [Clostridium sporogenes]MBA4509767.1 aspartyl-phosphate phosphatase Spo0E family protein [Clostridium sporogenes]